MYFLNASNKKKNQKHKAENSRSLCGIKNWHLKKGKIC